MKNKYILFKYDVENRWIFIRVDKKYKKQETLQTPHDSFVVTEFKIEKIIKKSEEFSKLLKHINKGDKGYYPYKKRKNGKDKYIYIPDDKRVLLFYTTKFLEFETDEDARLYLEIEGVN